MGRYLGRFRTQDMIGLGRTVPVRSRDQEAEQEEPEGELICRVMQTGADSWAGHDSKGRVLRIKRGRDGALEIRHAAETEDDADPDIVGTYPGAGGDPARATGRTGDGAMARFARTGDWAHHGAALAEYQRKIDAYYGNK